MWMTHSRVSAILKSRNELRGIGVGSQEKQKGQCFEPQLGGSLENPFCCVDASVPRGAGRGLGKYPHNTNSDVTRLINCISQATNRLKGFNREIHKLEHPPFDLGMAEEAINSLTKPQEKKYFINVLYFVSDPKSPFSRIYVLHR